MTHPAKQYYTPEEYFRLEETSVEKHEYFQGEVFQMAGASEIHNLIVANITTALVVGLRQKPCKVYSSDMRLQVGSNGLYTYADTSVVCGTTEFSDDRTDTITNPIMVVEVLSPSTEKYDRSQKFELYRGLESLGYYLVIDQSRVYIELHRRVEGNKWLMETFISLDGIIEIAELGLEIAIQNLYDKTGLS